ncbi:MAG: hypothetical protein KDD51_04425 [Bdellovibrionales bacterium]|nr:hypothetical protein [Bdellovibrionales bacterium]
MNEPSVWKKCSTCKKEIPFRSKYWACNVSTCNVKRKSFAFCSVECWDAHIPVMNHRSAWSEEKMAPSREEWARVLAEPTEGKVSLPKGERKMEQPSAPNSDEILVVASKLKAYIRDRSGMNTSKDTLEALSDMIRNAADNAIDKARTDGRKTVMARDF